MSVRRVMGSETEYGIAVPGQTAANHMLASSQIVNAYLSLTNRAAPDRSPKWDFEEESPLRDARGYDAGPVVGRDAFDTLPDDEVGLANAILTSGARLYVDHAHPEYSTPEVLTPLDLVRWDKAGEWVMRRAAEAAYETIPGAGRIQLYKNNTDGKGASYGAHENYLMSRTTPFSDIVRYLTPFFVSRQVVAGAGRVGIGQDGHEKAYQLSQRADFFEVEVGLETTLKRPIINTRDEPHADPERYRRLHVIIGDANLSEVATYLKVGTTAIVLDMIEQRWFADNGVDLSLEAPVAALRAISHDPTLKARVPLRDGRSLSGLELQTEYFDQARKFVLDRYGDDADEQTRDVLARWEQVLETLRADPMRLSDTLDWVAKLAILEGYREREGLAWGSAKLALIDLQYSDVRPDRGLYYRLVARGRMQRLLTDDEIEWAVAEPPRDTRAYFRGRCLAKYPDQVAAASWDSVIFDVGRETLQRVPMLDPLRGTRAHVEDLLARCDTAAALVDEITGGR